MNWDQIAGNWKQVKGKIKKKWRKLTDDDLDVIAGKHDQFVGKLQKIYGVPKERAEREADDWKRSSRTIFVWSWLCRITLEAVHIFLTATSFTRGGDFIVIARFDRELLIEL